MALITRRLSLIQRDKGDDGRGPEWVKTAHTPRRIGAKEATATITRQSGRDGGDGGERRGGVGEDRSQGTASYS